MSNPYVLPAAIIQQEFLSVAPGVIQPQTAVIVGPQKRVFLSTDAADRLLIGYGAYNPSLDTVYAYAGLPVGAVVDQTSVALVLENILAQYASLTGAGVIQRGSVPNQVNIPSGLGFQFYDNGTTQFARNAAFKNRDVAIGDRVTVTAAGKTLNTRILGFINDVVPASVGAPDATANLATQAYSGTATNTTVMGTDHLATINTATTSFIGNIYKGYLADTYVLTCTVAGAPGTAHFKATSTQGDNVADILSVAFGTPFTIGTRGLRASIASAGSQAFVVGETYTFAVAAGYTRLAPVLTSASSLYNGGFDTVYQLKVVKGGLWSENPQIVVTTSTGIDAGPPVTVNYNVSFPVGQLGIAVKFNNNFSSTQGGLVLGDIYTVVASASKKGAVRTAVLSNPIDASIAAGTDLTVAFSIFKPTMSIPSVGYPAFGSTALVPGAATFTVSAGINVTDPSWTDTDGVTPLAIPVVAAQVFVPYTAVVTDQANILRSLSDPASVSVILGKTIPSNPLAYGVLKALENSAGQPVYFVSIASDDVTGYSAALTELLTHPDPYFRVVLSSDPNVLALLQGHVSGEASDDVGHRCIGLVATQRSPITALFDQKPNGDNWTGYVAVEPGSSPARYTRATVPGATFITSGVRAGDEFRTSFGVDAFGNATYKAAVVASVTDEENLVLAGSGYAAAVGSSSSLQRIQVVRTLTRDELADRKAATSSAFASRRIYNVFPAFPIAVPYYFAACAVAGLASSVVPHQPITNYSINGFADQAGPQLRYTQTQLNTMAAGGTLILTQTQVGGEIYIRHQLSTDNTDDARSEMSMTRNVDSVSDYLLQGLRVFVGKYNITDNFINLLDVMLRQRLNTLMATTATPSAGSQILTYDPASLSVIQNPVNRTEVDIVVEPTFPLPANRLVLKLRVRS